MRRSGLSVIRALLAAACGAPDQYAFESGSVEAVAARYVAEWGGQAAQYRAILQSENCVQLADTPIGVAWGDAQPASGDPRADFDTPDGRAETGYIKARRERLAQLGCSEQGPPLPPTDGGTPGD
jgi:hypothetical protein